MHKPLAIALALALAATACGSDDKTKESEVVKGGTFTFAIPADPGALEPATAALGATNTALGFAYDTLVATDTTGKIVPSLAEKWDAQPGKVTFTLRKNVTCADGSPVTATTVAGSMNYLTDPKNKATAVIPPGLKAVADDAAGTVAISTADPNPFLLESMTIVFVVCGKGLADRSVLKDGTSGSGPYQLTEKVADDHYTFKVRKEYAWGPGGTAVVDGMPDTVTLKVVKDESTAANLLTTGGLSAAQFVGADRKRVEAVPGIRKGSAPDGIGELFFNQKPGLPNAALDVRKALIQAVDLDELRKIAGQGNAAAATHLTSLAPDPCRGDSVTGNLPASDPAAAAAALKDKKIAIRLSYQTSAGAGVQAAMEYLASKWKPLGVDVKLVGAADAKYAESLFTTGDWDVAWVPLGLSLPTQLVTYLSGPTPDKKGTNFAYLNNASYTAKAGEAAKTVGAAGCQAWTAAEAELVKNVDVVPVIQPTQLVAGKGATLEVIGGIVRPTSIRMLAE
ncbi:ABC transporter substrate-binding protein [Actinocorallia lasiicapitis]